MIDRNQIMEDFINEHKYHEVWSNDYFKILIPDTAGPLNKSIKNNGKY